MRNLVYKTVLLTSIFISYLGILGVNAEEAVIKGIIINENNTGVAGARIAITQPFGGFLETTFSDSSGGFTFSNIKRGLYDFHIEANDYYNVNIVRHSIDPDTAQSMIFRLVAINCFEGENCEKGTISGTIYDDETDEPIPGVDVQILYYKGATSQWDGRYAIDDIPTGEFDIAAKVLGYSWIIFEDVILDGSKCYSINFRLIHGAMKSNNLIIIE